MSHTHLDAAEGVDHDHAGQGPVLLDIGGDVGAIVVDMPTGLADAEIEQRPVGAEGRGPRLHPHVGVVHRPVAGATVHAAVFGAVHEGRSELYVRPDGPVALVADVAGGRVAELHWPPA